MQNICRMIVILNFHSYFFMIQIFVFKTPDIISFLIPLISGFRLKFWKSLNCRHWIFLNSWTKRIHIMVFKHCTPVNISLVSQWVFNSFSTKRASAESIFYLFLFSESVQGWLRKLCRQCTHGGKIIKRGKAKQIQEAARVHACTIKSKQNVKGLN